MSLKANIPGLMFVLASLSPAVASQAAPAGSASADIVIGKTLMMPSKIFGRPIRLDVSLPSAYEASRDRYPVVVGFQIDNRFSAVSGVAAGLASAGIAPSLIVVSAGLDGSLFSLYTVDDRPGSGRGPDVLAFLRQDLFPFLESRYRIAPYRILLGHSASALFCLYAMFEEPDLIQAVLAAGLMFAEFDYPRVLEILEKSRASRRPKPQYLFFTQGDQVELTRDLAAFQNWLKIRRPDGLAWEFDPEPKENHGSLALMTLYAGLRTLFAGYAALPEDVGLRGGPAIRDYKKRLAERFGYDIGMARGADLRLRVKWTAERNFEALIGLARFGCEERPEDYFSHFRLADALNRAGRWAEAVPALEAALALAKKLPETERNQLLPLLEARLAEARNKARGEAKKEARRLPLPKSIAVL